MGIQETVCRYMRCCVRLKNYNYIESRPHIISLYESKDEGTYLPLDKIPGDTESNIEKMTLPVSATLKEFNISPFALFLCPSEKELHDIYEYILVSNNESHGAKFEKLKEIYALIKLYYQSHCVTGIKKVKLWSGEYLEQVPTKPYFKNQKIIIPDILKYRKKQKKYSNILAVACKLKNKSLKEKLIKFYFQYAGKVNRLEREKFLSASSMNDAVYFCDMACYIVNYAKDDCFIAQSSLESSTDKFIAHFQFIRGVHLPIFNGYKNSNSKFHIQELNWLLPGFVITINLKRMKYLKIIGKVQEICSSFSRWSQISITPVIRKNGSDKIELILILKKNCSAHWLLDKDVILNMPGWLESCGVFIDGTRQAEKFSQKGKENYYNDYSAPVKNVTLFKKIVLEYFPDIEY